MAWKLKSCLFLGWEARLKQGKRHEIPGCGHHFWIRGSFACSLSWILLLQAFSGLAQGLARQWWLNESAEYALSWEKSSSDQVSRPVVVTYPPHTRSSATYRPRMWWWSSNNTELVHLSLCTFTAVLKSMKPPCEASFGLQPHQEQHACTTLQMCACASTDAVPGIPYNCSRAT